MEDSLDDGDEVGVGRRVGQLTGLFLIVLALARLGRLLQTGPGLPQWHLILIASAFLGGVVWWLIRQATELRWVAFAALFAGGALLLVRVAVPATLTWGVIPGAETLPAFAEEMSSALRLIRAGIPPVYPEEGLVGILAVLTWLLGAGYVHGVSGGPVSMMILPPGVVYLQFAVFDRQPGGLGWMSLSAIGLGLAITAVALDRKQDVGRARDSEGRPTPRRAASAAFVTAGITAMLALATAGSASDLISEYGNIPWRSGVGGSGPGSGGIAFDRFIDLRQRLQSRENALLFQATLGPDAPPGGQLYWRMETLDEFDGVSWKRSTTQIRNYEPGRPMADDEIEYRGSTAEVLHRVYIARLAMEIAPTAGVPTAIHEIERENALNPRSFRYAGDASLYYPQGLQPDDVYQIQGTYPLHGADLGLLATGGDGQLTPIFANAAEAGLFSATPGTPAEPVERPDSIDFYTRLPENLPAAITGIARVRTNGATTDFERAWMLQYWFRDSGEFIYSQDVTTGHSSLILEDWLTDSTSRNYRTGYCEQFAAAMAVLGRALGIPSRVVWGFTPGSVTTTPEGVEVIEVRDTNAHAWVEMWLDPVGWVRFDPTPRGEFQPASITAGFDPNQFLPEEEARTPVETPVAPGINDPDAQALADDPPLLGLPAQTRRWLLLVPALALVATLIPLTKTIRRRRRLRRIRSGDISAAWDEIIDRLGDLGEPVTPSLTPIELARSTDSALVPLAVRYSAEVYGGLTGRAEESDLITAEWWIRTRFDSSRRMRAAFNPGSLFRDR